MMAATLRPVLWVLGIAALTACGRNDVPGDVLTSNDGSARRIYILDEQRLPAAGLACAGPGAGAIEVFLVLSPGATLPKTGAGGAVVEETGPELQRMRVALDDDVFAASNLVLRRTGDAPALSGGVLITVPFVTSLKSADRVAVQFGDDGRDTELTGATRAFLAEMIDICSRRSASPQLNQQ